jgi:predicted Zn-dependent protease
MNPDEQAFLELLAFVYLENAQAAKARVLLEALAGLDQAAPRWRNSLAWACLELNQPEDALKALAPLAADHSLPEADRRATAYLRGQALLRQGKTSEARAALADFVAVTA